MTHEKVLQMAWHYLHENAPFLFLHLNGEGVVTDANAFTKERILGGAENGDVHDIFLSFAGPLDLNALREEPDKVHLMSAATMAGLPETFQVRFVPWENETLVFGSLDADESSRLRRELITLNNEISVLARELQKKNHELEELNRLKNQFLGMAAHDLRKPVSAILNYSEFLIDEAGQSLDEEHLGFLKTIHGSTDLMRRVIDDFLDIAMIESGRFDLELGWGYLVEVIQKSVDLNGLTARKRGVSLRVVANETIPSTRMDSVKIEQVLNNLISNAIEHSPADSEVQIEVLRTDKGVAVMVKDAGPGIPPHDRETLFRPFVRGSERKAPGVKSTGLGLAISKKIVEAHGGKIWIEEGEGRGAVFAFLLPQTAVEKEEKG